MDQHQAWAAVIGSLIKYLDNNKSARETEDTDIRTPSAHFEKLEEKFPILIPVRFPITNSCAPLEPDYDNIINTLVDKCIIAPNQIGLPRHQQMLGCLQVPVPALQAPSPSWATRCSSPLT